jgi:nitrate/TMAO reductase-like tetraheme cytochrome c subunit
VATRLSGLLRQAEGFVALNLAAIVVVGVVAVVALLVGVPVVSMDSPAFFSRYPELSKNYQKLETSSHKGLTCSDCHVDKRNVIVHDLALAGDYYASVIGKQKTPLFTKFEAPGNDACLGCHRNDWSDDASRTAKVPHPAHLRVASETRSCVKCHKWTAHEETTMQKHKTMPFSGVCASYGCHVGTKTSDQCATCHHSLAQGDWKAEHAKVVQTAGASGCLESCHDISQCRQCHTTGKQPTVAGPTVESGLQAIQTAHVKADWLQQHGAIARNDQSQCMKCHVSDGQCRECHSQRPAFHGSQATWIGTHKDVAKNNEQRCAGTCHQKSWCDACHKQFKEMR